MFVSQSAASESGAVKSYGLRKQIEVVKNCRTVKKQHMKFNSATPKIDIDPETLVRTLPSRLVEKMLYCQTNLGMC